jgi:multiple sugar transport system substrate-binding protein
MKRFNFVILIFILLLGVLSGCSEKSSGADTDTITVWAMGEEAKHLSEQTKKFEDNNPGIKVKVQALPWDTAHDKLLTAVASGNGPDVLQLGTSWVPEFADAGALLNLTPYLEDNPDFDPSGFFEGAAASMKHGEEVVSIPWYVDVRVIYYRTDLLAEVGYDKAPETWEELKDAATKLANRSSDDYGFVHGFADQFAAVYWPWQNGSDVVTSDGQTDFESKEFKEAMEYYVSFFEEGLSPINEPANVINSFVNGTMPMFIDAPWRANDLTNNYPDLEGKWGIAMMPKKETRTSLVGGSNLAIFHKSKNVDNAIKLISYLSESQTQKEWFEVVGALPSKKDVWEDPIFESDPVLTVFGNQLEDSKPSPQIIQWESIAQEIIREMEKVTVGGADLEERIDDLKLKTDKILGK